MKGLYRKRPVVIEAWELTEQNADEVAEWCSGDTGATTAGVMIGTLEGSMLARWGDFVIHGVQGEFYSCKPDIFEKTYEPA